VGGLPAPRPCLELFQRLALGVFDGRHQHRERSPPPPFGVELRLVLERGPPVTELVEELHPPELVE
jgi:hypothetical protein